MATLMDPLYATVPPPSFIEKDKVSHVLDGSHQEAFQRAIKNILQTKIAETTFAQIVDGLPLNSVAFDTAGLSWDFTLSNHDTLCDGALERLIEIRETFEPLDMELPLQTLRRYQETPPGSDESTLALIELVAVTVHRIAVLLYKTDVPHWHSGVRMDGICSNKVRSATFPHPTPFCLDDYADPAQYPEGVAELPGYWAEDRIFGGVVVFSRGESGNECNDIWLHASRKGLTHRICALTQDQLASLVRFLRADNPGDEKPCPLPILVDKTNRRRVDNEIAIPEHNIYRDRWERKIRFTDFEEYQWIQGGMCIIDEVDYPGGSWEYFAECNTAAQIGARNVDRPL